MISHSVVGEVRVNLRDKKHYTYRRFLPHGAIVIQTALPDYCGINATCKDLMNDSTGLNKGLTSQPISCLCNNRAPQRCDVSP